ncbi:hypothetical protein ULMS_14380 [Patiriisocius marinistellae]|uniref:Uncharacterized protein n=1 Tax=Patiriisocius marinistellae TaxID=2494560 RepID=A0A5J4FVC6_9FLAO|nr:hypothetical protein ULMS_14380 [Patiriisocius marinistellae]
MRPYWQFYKDIFLFIVGFSLLGVIAFGVFWGFFFFISFGLIFGFYAFHYFKENELYSYYNLGIKKRELYRAAFFINLLIGLPAFSILFILISIILGDFSLTSRF